METDSIVVFFLVEDGVNIQRHEGDDYMQSMRVR